MGYNLLKWLQRSGWGAWNQLWETTLIIYFMGIFALRHPWSLPSRQSRLSRPGPVTMMVMTWCFRHLWLLQPPLQNSQKPTCPPEPLARSRQTDPDFDFIGIDLIRLDWFRFDETLIWCLQYHSLVQGKKYLQCICVVISSFGLNLILFYWNWLDLICLDLIWFDWTWFDLTLIGFDSIWFDLSIWHWLGLIGFD